MSSEEPDDLRAVYAWLRAREKAQKTLGDKFDIKQFHEVLLDGAMPLSILEKRIEERTAAAMKA